MLFFSTVKVVYGSCQPDELCSYDECDKLQSLLADSGPIQISNLKNCKAFCCKEDLCNGENSTQVVEYTTASIVASTIQSIATTAPSVPGRLPLGIQITHFSLFILC